MFDAVVLGLRPVGVSRSGTATHLSVRRVTPKTAPLAVTEIAANIFVDNGVRDNGVHEEAIGHRQLVRPWSA